MAEAQGQVIATRAPMPVAHEAGEVDRRAVWQTAAMIAGTIVAAVLAAAGLIALFHHLTGRALSPPNWPPTDVPSPALQSAPSLDLAKLRAEKRAKLDRYAWIDRDKGIVRIPIERAMSLLIARGVSKPR